MTGLICVVELFNVLLEKKGGCCNRRKLSGANQIKTPLFGNSFEELLEINALVVWAVTDLRKYAGRGCLTNRKELNH